MASPSFLISVFAWMPFSLGSRPRLASHLAFRFLRFRWRALKFSSSEVSSIFLLQKLYFLIFIEN
jgi:hypothetical protein